MRLMAESGCTPEIVQFMGAHPIRAGRETFTGRVMLSGEAVHLPDVLADSEYDFGEGPRIGNYRALLAAPLLREGRVEGVFAFARPDPVPFTERQIEMVRAFADQAVIAIENARLFDEVQARTRELAASLDDLRKAQDRLIQSEKLASLGQLTAGIAHEIKNPLNFINNYSALSRELVDELAEAIKGAAGDEAAHGEVDELIGAIGGNLDKIVQHGKRADSIVKNMLLHSREGSGERSTTERQRDGRGGAQSGLSRRAGGEAWLQRDDRQVARPERRRRRGLRPRDDPGASELDFERILRDEQAQAERGRPRLRTDDRRLDARPWAKG